MDRNDQLIRMMELTTPETMPEAVLDHDGVRGVDVSPSEDSLEAGIAAVFDAIRNGSGGEAEDGDAPDNGVTFALLTELNRLWEQPPA
jgi:hypothetical protein